MLCHENELQRGPPHFDFFSLGQNERTQYGYYAKYKDGNSPSVFLEVTGIDWKDRPCSPSDLGGEPGGWRMKLTEYACDPEGRAIQCS